MTELAKAQANYGGLLLQCIAYCSMCVCVCLCVFVCVCACVSSGTMHLSQACGTNIVCRLGRHTDAASVLEVGCATT